MKRTWIIYILMAVALLLVISSCTPPPPENPKNDEPVVEVEEDDPVVEEEEPIVEEDSSKGGTSETVTIEGEDGTTITNTLLDPGEGEVVVENDTIEEEPVEEEPVEDVPDEDGTTFPENLFASYDSWPPDSITADEVAMLGHALVVFETTKGLIKVKLFPEQAPLHSANCVKLVQDGFYDGLKFHRVMNNFMSQGGDPDGTGGGGPGYTIPAEIGLPHLEGSMSAARTGDNVNPERRSSGSQFYFVHSNTSANFLDGNYSVYGQIIEGVDVNLSLSINYTNAGPIPGAETDSIIRAWVEYS